MLEVIAKKMADHKEMVRSSLGNRDFEALAFRRGGEAVPG